MIEAIGCTDLGRLKYLFESNGKVWSEKTWRGGDTFICGQLTLDKKEVVVTALFDNQGRKVRPVEVEDLKTYRGGSHEGTAVKLSQDLDG